MENHPPEAMLLALTVVAAEIRHERVDGSRSSPASCRVRDLPAGMSPEGPFP